MSERNNGDPGVLVEQEVAHNRQYHASPLDRESLNATLQQDPRDPLNWPMWLKVTLLYRIRPLLLTGLGCYSDTNITSCCYRRPQHRLDKPRIGAPGRGLWHQQGPSLVPDVGLPPPDSHFRTL